jgi:hypothetical protein
MSQKYTHMFDFRLITQKSFVEIYRQLSFIVIFQIASILDHRQSDTETFH